jgi:glutathione S-transferase
MSDLTLYHCPGTRSTGTLWLLEEMGAEYTLETINVRAELDDVVKRVDETLTQNDYLLGDSFSASDICAGGAVSWMVAFGMIEPTPAIKAYLERLQSRKAYRRMLEIDAELAPKA